MSREVKISVSGTPEGLREFFRDTDLLVSKPKAESKSESLGSAGSSIKDVLGWMASGEGMSFVSKMATLNSVSHTDKKAEASNASASKQTDFSPLTVDSWFSATNDLITYGFGSPQIDKHAPLIRQVGSVMKSLKVNVVDADGNAKKETQEVVSLIHQLGEKFSSYAEVSVEKKESVNKESQESISDITQLADKIIDDVASRDDINEETREGILQMQTKLKKNDWTGAMNEFINVFKSLTPSKTNAEAASISEEKKETVEDEKKETTAQAPQSSSVPEEKKEPLPTEESPKASKPIPRRPVYSEPKVNTVDLTDVGSDGPVGNLANIFQAAGSGGAENPLAGITKMFQGAASGVTPGPVDPTNPMAGMGQMFSQLMGGLMGGQATSSATTTSTASSKDSGSSSLAEEK